MMMALRTLALAIAIAGLIDPAFATHRKQPLPIEVRAAASPAAAAARDRLLADLGGEVTTDAGEASAAIVVIGNAIPHGPLPAGVPVSVVAMPPASGVNLRIADVAESGIVLPGQDAVVRAEVEAAGAAGLTSVIALEQHGVELARVEHKWTRDGERFAAELRFAPPMTGIEAVRVVARPVAGEADSSDNIADTSIVAAARTLRVAVFETRPSWAAGFVRRALEDDPVFAVASLVRSSRGLAARAGSPPAALTAAALAPFDAVLIGAPEELTAREVDALDSFARDRGGAVILLPDRRPSGPYVRLVPANGFDEMLLDKPIAVPLAQGGAVTASEFSLPARLGGGASPIASTVQNGVSRAVIASWPHGLGRVIFSGALDSWRYRAQDGGAFARFWTGTVANAAASAAPPLAIAVRPSLAAPGDPVSIRATVRPTEFAHEGARIVVPPVEARVVSGDGAQIPVRLWPAAEPGVYEGAVAAPAAGRYDVQVRSSGGAAADALLLARDGLQHPGARDEDRLRLVASTTGGVATTANDFAALESRLRELPRRTVGVPAHPLRSPWWIVPFAVALCAEWTIRRRRGLR